MLSWCSQLVKLKTLCTGGYLWWGNLWLLGRNWVYPSIRFIYSPCFSQSKMKRDFCKHSNSSCNYQELLNERAVWELQGTNCQAGAPWSTFPHLWRSDLRYTTIMSLEQHVSASGRLYLPNKTHGLQFKPDNLHKYRKITTRDKRRKTAVEEFNSSRSWEGSNQSWPLHWICCTEKMSNGRRWWVHFSENTTVEKEDMCTSRVCVHLWITTCRKNKNIFTVKRKNG